MLVQAQSTIPPFDPQTSPTSSSPCTYPSRQQRPPRRARNVFSTMQSVVQPLVQPISHRTHYPHPSLDSSTIARTASGLTMPTPPLNRKRKRPLHQLSVSYSEVQEIDADGRMREVIIIEDTPPPPATISPAVSTSTQYHGYSSSHQPPLYNAPIRTRARAAAEAQVLTASTSSAITAPPATKKRKREQDVAAAGVVTTKRAQVNGRYPAAINPAKTSWASGSAATEDVRLSLPSTVHYP